jgi:RNA polymerase sigma-70 factor (ECF subfamily)
MSKRPDAAPRPVAEEESFVRGCRAGDPVAFDAFFRAYVGRVERVLARLVGPTADLEDLVQTTFVEAMRSFRRFRGEASVATWVTRIAVHVAQHQLRRGVRRMVPLELVPAAEEPREETRGPDGVASDRQLAMCVHAALDRVTPPKRIAFLLYTVEGCSIAEVAALMGASQAATKSRIWFARREVLALAHKDRRLRDLVEGGGGEGP